MSKRIFVVEGDTSMRWLLKELLEDDAYEVDLATDDLDALTRLEHQHSVYDVIILDVAIPGLDAPQLIQKMKNSNLWSFTSIIALSADVMALQQAAHMGIDHCLHKPFDLDALLKLVSAL